MDERTRSVWAFTLKLARQPQQAQSADIQALRDAGLSDAAVHDVVAICAYFSFVNRIALGLGVELEEPGASTGFGGDSGKS